MARLIGDIEQDILIEEALMENEARNEINRRYKEWEDDYMRKSKLSRALQVIKVYIKCEIVLIKARIARYFDKK